MTSKIKEIEEYINKFELIIMSETWIEKKDRQTAENLLPKNYIWIWTDASRINIKGRAIAGIIVGIKKPTEYRNAWNCTENFIAAVEVKVNNEWWKIIAVYNRSGLSIMKHIIEEQLEDSKDMKCVLVGDINGRIGNLGGKFEDQHGTPIPRNTKDEVINKEGELWMQVFNEYGMSILNGNMDGDWEGEFTHVDHKSESVIDYATANDRAWPKIESFVIGTMENSDHFPLETTLKEMGVYEEPEEGKVVQHWCREGGAAYNRAMSGSSSSQSENWQNLRDKMWNNTPKRLIKPYKHPSWWDKQCYEARRKVTSMGKQAKCSNMWNSYRQEKRQYKNLIKCKKEQFNNKRKKELLNVKNLNQAWTYIKKQRKTKSSEFPKSSELINHFTTLLEGHNSPSMLGNILIVSEEVKELTWNEFETHGNKLKLKKAAGADQIKAEAFIYADMSTKGYIKEMLERCLNGQPIPEEWRHSTIWPIHKKGSKLFAENYRGIAIGNVIHKLYASIINSRLEQFVEERMILPDTQNGFRKMRSTVDNIYILNHIVNVKLAAGKKIWAFFVDFKAAFDSVDRNQLYEKLFRLNIPTYITEAIRNLYRRTPYNIENEIFYTEKGLKQGCPLSPLLFALYISDLETTLRNFQSGGIVVGREKIFSLAYADDLVILSERSDDMKEMLQLLNRYTRRKGLAVNILKSQMMVFSKGGRLSKEKWKFDGSNIIEVRSFKYLGFTFQSNGRYSKHIEEMATVGKKEWQKCGI